MPVVHQEVGVRSPDRPHTDRSKTPAPTKRSRHWLLLLPVLVFNVLAFIVPLGVFGLQSFRPFEGPAAVGEGFTLESWARLVADPEIRQMFAMSLLLVLIITVGCVAIGVPIAYLVARSRRWGGILLLGIVASSFVSAAVQTLGWLILLSGSGPVLGFASALGLPVDGVRILQTPAAVIIAMIHVEIHYMVLVCAPAIMTVSPELELAARGLGATWATTMRKVVIPMAWPGILAGALLVMATAAGSFTTPAILGGQLVPWIPIFITDQMTTVLNYPMAAAASILLVALVLAVSAIATAATRRLMTKRSS